MTDTLISVVIPAYNAEHSIESSIRSVLAQSIEDIEVIVIDDRSSDGTTQRIRGIEDPRLKLFVQEKNGGPSAARNAGMARAAGKWVAFVDADDQLLPNHLEVLCRSCEQYGVIFAAPSRLTAVPDRAGNLRALDATSTESPEIVDLSEQNLIDAVSCVFSFVELDFIRRHDIRFPEGEDGGDWIDFMLALIKHGASGKLVASPSTYLYRITGDHFSSSLRSIVDQQRALHRIANDASISQQNRENFLSLSNEVRKRIVVAALREGKYGYAAKRIFTNPSDILTVIQSLAFYVYRTARNLLAKKRLYRLP